MKKIFTILMLVIIAVTFTACGGGDKKSSSSSSQTAQTQAAPKAEPTLHVKPEVFQQRYNEYLHSRGGILGESGALDIGEPEIKKGSVNDAVVYANNELNLALNQTIDKKTGEIKEVFTTAVIAGKDTQTIQASLMCALVSYNALIYAVDPNADIDKIQENLGLHESAGEWIKNTDTTYNKIKYFKMVMKGIGLSFGASVQ